ncbi:thioredoxin-related transmembrane protein 1 [Neodiprion pinetum]|uniref:Thioredoxin-related transmembrane protein 1 n=1 Tax=Neodiprion lecontei TaxID=441921 RepID=A0A6J0BG01_NEOLC|nr:thioredoxin-related transmembrane protein 1 [Neodiprion lecontei]XP_046419433.1 thioredoxin-related transmembrane protein 1-like [Neodiprion fabricii]XP_046475463.1 thioredoxin-related transmembrane protein 1-like [Neodiprion pinetum]XP_046612992.1 thioredoxin-related transmembrane protein 1 [Neodiprion virginianus]
MIVVRYFACFSIFFVLSSIHGVLGGDGGSLQLTEDNWNKILVGEWMVEFYAPWCPACKALEPVWESFASWKNDLGIRVGKVDVTDSPGLSGRFMVTALPTIFHAKDGIFRQYKSPRDKESLISFVKDKKWLQLEPISSWKSPNSIQMSVISYFFKLSQILRGMHNKLMEDYGLPTWGSYLIFSIATIILGAILGLFIVCLIDFIYPPKPVSYPSKKKEKDGSGGFMQEKNEGDEELVENVKDDLVDEDASGSDAQEEDKEEDETKSVPSSPNVRKRKPRKAD